MKRIMTLCAIAALVAGFTPMSQALAGNGYRGIDIPGMGFIDLNEDGYNDNAPDSDGDGIPDCYEDVI